MLSEEEIERNVRGIKRILEQLITSGNGAGPAPQILNNLVQRPLLLLIICRIHALHEMKSFPAASSWHLQS